MDNDIFRSVDGLDEKLGPIRGVGLDAVAVSYLLPQEEGSALADVLASMRRYPSCPDYDLLGECDRIRAKAADLWTNQTSRADCLWAHGFVRRP